MSRRLVPLAVLLVASSAPAQELPPPSPFDLSRGLRESGMPDLALEYLTDLSKAAPADVQKVLPLERAKCRLDLAGTESDEALRSALVAEAKREFDQFVKANPGHPRLPEAAVALAQLQTLDGKTQVQRANRLPADQQATELAKARPLFVSAGKQFSAAADALKKLADAEEPNTPRQRELTQNYLQAVIDQAMNLYLLADSYPDESKGAEFEARQKAAKDAALIFDSVWGRNKEAPQGWAARAWAAECLRLQFEPVKANNGLKAVVEDAAKVRTPASAAGARMARFFQLRDEYVQKGGAEGASADRVRIRAACQAWLKDYADTGKPTWEVYATRYYLGRMCILEAQKRENGTWEQVKPMNPKDKPTEKLVAVKEGGLAMFREADAQFKILVRTENEFTERAARQRPQALRWLVGNPDRPPAQFATFDDCYMAALVQLESARSATAADERGAALDKAIALLERADGLPVPAESTRDAARALLDLARTYSVAGRPHAAAVYAENLARTARSPAFAAKAAAIALDSYARAANTTAPDNEDGRAVDRDRRIGLAMHLEKVAPNEAETDAARLQLGADLYRAGRKLDAFEAFSRVPARYPRVAQARLFEGIAAFDLTRPLGPDETRADDLPADKKQSVFARAVADLSAVPVPPDAAKDAADTGVTPVADYFNLRLQLAQLHITQGAKGYDTAEKTLVATAAAAARHPGLPADEKVKFAMRCEQMRIRTVFGQAMPLYQQGKYGDAAARFSELLAEVLKAGPAVKAKQPADVADLAKSLDADRIRLLLVPTLNAYVRDGSAAKTAELLDALKAFGGDLSTSARVVQQGVASIRPTVDALRREKKTEEADKLVAAVAGMVAKLATEKNLPVDVRLNLGRSFRDLGEYAKAVELLVDVPAPANKEALKAELKAAENETPEQVKQRDADNAAAPLYRIAQLELIRSYRLLKKYPEAAAILDDALGKEGELKGRVKPRAGGWATRFPEFRKEAILLIEAKAAAAPDAKTAIPLWNEAINNWSGWAGEYLQALNQLNQKFSPNKRKVEQLSTRLRLIDELAQMNNVNFPAVTAKVTADLAQAEGDAAKADGEVADAAKGVDAAAAKPADLEKARDRLEAARDAAADAGRRVSELKARLPMLDEYAKKANVDWADEAKAVQKELDPIQKEMGEQERRMNPLKSIWQDVLSEQFRCLFAAQSAALKADKVKLAEFVTKHGKSIADFEKNNRPLPVNVRQKMFDLLDGSKELKDEYRKAGGVDLLAPPAANQ